MAGIELFDVANKSIYFGINNNSFYQKVFLQQIILPFLPD